jgi:hypothetical protein
MSPPIDGVRRRRPVGLALTLMLAPYALAVLSLVVGLYGSLGWVYLSIGLSVLGVPLFALGVYLLARRLAESPSALARYRFNSPPGWPPPPAGWAPPAGWQPDPSWPAAPVDWQWWLPVDSA